MRPKVEDGEVWTEFGGVDAQGRHVSIVLWSFLVVVRILYLT